MGILDVLKKLFTPGPDRAIDFSTLNREIAERAVLVVDVREPGEFRSGHIPDAINLPLSRFSVAALPADRPIVFICLSGMRSGRALGLAMGAGLETSRHFRGGMSEWKRLGGAMA